VELFPGDDFVVSCLIPVHDKSYPFKLRY
jgi:hypothetical protein